LGLVFQKICMKAHVALAAALVPLAAGMQWQWHLQPSGASAYYIGYGIAFLDVSSQHGAELHPDFIASKCLQWDIMLLLCPACRSLLLPCPAQQRLDSSTGPLFFCYVAAHAAKQRAAAGGVSQPWAVFTAWVDCRLSRAYNSATSTYFHVKWLRVPLWYFE
jgi:hypothetical protein